EALVQVSAFADDWDLMAASLGLSEEDQGTVLEQVEKAMQSKVEIRLADAPMEFQTSVVRFVVLDPELGYVEDTRERIPLDEAVLGITRSASVSGVSQFELTWNWFPSERKRIPVEVASAGPTVGRFVTPQEPSFPWEAEVEARSEPVPVPEVERLEVPRLPLIGIIAAGMFLLSVISFIVKRRSPPPWIAWILVGSILLGLVAVRWKIEIVEMPDEKQKDQLIYAVLRNIYQAFDYREESEIYDALAQSITGDLLERVYLEIRGSLELENAGGPRVRVDEVALREWSLESLQPGGAFRVRGEWVTVGEVTHWGHTHKRTNRYEAILQLDGSSGSWKLSELALLSEEREKNILRQMYLPEP
ncbi:MAG: hypothetical protein AAGA96_19620, partial [Verrucomicrobiota bacterium]